MGACEWCGKEANLFNYDGMKICVDCETSAKLGKCRKCGIPSFGLVRGLCMDCLQLDAINSYSKQMEEDCSNESDEEKDAFSAAMTFTESEFEKYMVYDPNGLGFTPEDLKKSLLMKKIWIMTKLTAAGITDSKLINDNLEDIIYLIDNNFEKLLNKKCILTIIEGSGLHTNRRNMATRNTIIASKNKVVIAER